MSEGTIPDPETPLARFREAFWSDWHAGGIRPLVEYLNMFSGDDLGIAREFAAINDALNRGERPEDVERLTASDAIPTWIDERPLPRASNLASGSKIGPYQVVRLLGVGGQGAVYLAHDSKVVRQVALKIITLGPIVDDLAFTQFKREAEIVAKLEHPGICPIFEVERTRDIAWIAMRFVPGVTLAARLGQAHPDKTKPTRSALFFDLEDYSTSRDDEFEALEARPPLTSEEIGRMVTFISSVARILDFAHVNGVVHRDVKPSNIMIDTNGQPVVCDFGLARDVAGDGESIVGTGVVAGTEPYMSPEQILGRGSRIDRTTDIYSLGITLYECLACARPFRQTPERTVREAILCEPFPDIRRENPAVSSEVASVLDFACARESQDRYPTALAFADDLERALGGGQPVGPMEDVTVVRDSVDLPPDLDDEPDDLAIWEADPESSLLGNYRLLQPLASNERSTVYLAADTRLGRRAAVKVVARFAADHDRTFSELQHEAEITGQLEDPAVCPVYDIGEDKGVFWMAMRYIPGMSLHEALSRLAFFYLSSENPAPGRVDLRGIPLGLTDWSSPSSEEKQLALVRMLRFFEKAARAIHRIHERGVVHNDIKPNKIMVVPSEEPVILDLGLALGETKESAALFERGRTIGTPGYMAPECVSGWDPSHGPTVDVWSFGVVLYETFSLTKPFTGRTQESLFEATLQGSPKPPCELRSDIPGMLQDVILKCLSMQPAKRYECMQALAEALAGVRRGSWGLPAAPGLLFRQTGRQEL